MPSWFLLYTFVTLATTLSQGDGFVRPPHPQTQRGITFLQVAANNKPLTDAQQEQLDKYGPTPETSMEILVDRLIGGKDNSDSEDDFFARTGADDAAKEKWRTFLSNLEQMQGGNNDGNSEETSKALSPKDVSMMFFREGSKS